MEKAVVGRCGKSCGRKNREGRILIPIHDYGTSEVLPIEKLVTGQRGDDDLEKGAGWENN